MATSNFNFQFKLSVENIRRDCDRKGITARFVTSKVSMAGCTCNVQNVLFYHSLIPPQDIHSPIASLGLNDLPFLQHPARFRFLKYPERAFSALCFKCMQTSSGFSYSLMLLATEQLHWSSPGFKWILKCTTELFVDGASSFIFHTLTSPQCNLTLEIQVRMSRDDDNSD